MHTEDSPRGAEDEQEKVEEADDSVGEGMGAENSGPSSSRPRCRPWHGALEGHVLLVGGSDKHPVVKLLHPMLLPATAGVGVGEEREERKADAYRQLRLPQMEYLLGDKVNPRAHVVAKNHAFSMNLHVIVMFSMRP